MSGVGPGDPGDYYDDYERERGAVAQACDEIGVLPRERDEARAEVERKDGEIQVLDDLLEIDRARLATAERLIGEQEIRIATRTNERDEARAEVEQLRTFIDKAVMPRYCEMFEELGLGDPTTSVVVEEAARLLRPPSALPGEGGAT